LDFKFTTDGYGYETTWEVADSNGNKLASGDNYGNDQPYREQECFDDSECYKLTIYDEYGDGFCCSGANDADPKYWVGFGGDKVAEGGADNFGDSKEIQFGSCGGDPGPDPTPDPTPGPTPSPTPSPTSEPTSSPTPEPTPTPVASPVNEPTSHGGCNDGEFAVTVRLFTDDWPHEISWRIRKDGSTVESSPAFDEPNQDYTEHMCLENAEYRFIVTDSYSDGIAPPGRVELIVEQEIIATENDFGNRFIKDFGSSTDGGGGGGDCDDSGPCGDDKLLVEVKVTTDDWPEELSWIIKRSSGSFIYASGDFEGANKEYNSGPLCVDKRSHRFEIYDSYGDGILSPGKYELKVNNCVIQEGHDFGYEANKLFG